MQIVIDIDDEIAQGIIEGYGDEPRNIVRSFQATIADVIKNGIPIPKGHGRIGDLDRVRAKIFNASMDEHFMPIKSLTCDDVTDIIDDIPTIIPADKEE